MKSRAKPIAWGTLTWWALTGFVLEALHGFKVGPYLDDELTRLLLTLMHAHGVGLSLVAIVHASSAPEAPVWTGKVIRLSAILLPAGFGLGAIAHPEGDPSLGIVLVPLMGIALLAALASTAKSYWE